MGPEEAGFLVAVLADWPDAVSARVAYSGLVQIGRFLGNTQPQVRTLSGPFAKGIVRFVFES